MNDKEILSQIRRIQTKRTEKERRPGIIKSCTPIISGQFRTL